jgi:GGDEF domain-containing protein
VAALHRTVAREIAEMLRSTDIVGLIRDDIVVLLVHTPAADGTLIGERIRERIETTTFSLMTPSQVTLSIALSCFPTDATADGALLAHAEAQLQAAPRAGL